MASSASIWPPLRSTIRCAYLSWFLLLASGFLLSVPFLPWADSLAAPLTATGERRHPRGQHYRRHDQRHHNQQDHVPHREPLHQHNHVPHRDHLLHLATPGGLLLIGTIEGTS